jgi:hypothetical protein
MILFSGEYWTQKAHGSSDNKGKQLRRNGFALAEERYGTSFANSGWVSLISSIFIFFV